MSLVPKGKVSFEGVFTFPPDRNVLLKSRKHTDTARIMRVLSALSQAHQQIVQELEDLTNPNDPKWEAEKRATLALARDRVSIKFAQLVEATQKEGRKLEISIRDLWKPTA